MIWAQSLITQTITLSDLLIRIRRLRSDKKIWEWGYLQSIYNYITRSGKNTGAGESTNLDLGTMKLYTHLGIGLFMITNLRLHNWSQSKIQALANL